MMNLVLNKLTIVVFIDLFISLIVSYTARGGNYDAFCYKKSKSSIRKQRKEMTKLQRIFWIYSERLTFLPNYCKLFYIVRIIEATCSTIVIILLLISKIFPFFKPLLVLVLVREICVNLPFIVFFFYCNIIYRDPKNPKGWGFPY